MAVMYPPELAVGDVKSDAEPKMFAALRDGLPDEWEVFHSAGLLNRHPADGLEHDEIDFVLCHPEKGIVCLEVKGGGIECRHGEWFRTKKGEPDKHMEDPFEQAVDHRYALERQIS